MTMGNARSTSNASGGNSSLRRVGIYAAILGIVFLLGLVPMWLTARERAEGLAGAEGRLRVSEMENFLGSAALNAGRGEYEQARQATSEFFTRLRPEVDLRDRSAIAPQRQQAVEGLFVARDEIITLLARNDPAAAARLNNLYFAFRSAIGKP